MDDAGDSGSEVEDGVNVFEVVTAESFVANVAVDKCSTPHVVRIIRTITSTEIVENHNVSTGINKEVNKVAANKSRTAQNSDEVTLVECG